MGRRIASWALFVLVVSVVHVPCADAQQKRPANMEPVASSLFAPDGGHAIVRPEFESRRPVAFQNEFSATASSAGDGGWVPEDSIPGDLTDCSDECCNAASPCCPSCGPPFGLAAGVEATYLAPFVEVVFGLGDFAGNPFEAAPRLWLHWQDSSGWGLRGRYWDFDVTQQRSAAFDLGNALVSNTFDDDLDVYAVDVEATRTFSLGQMDCWAGFGARQGRLHRHNVQNQTIYDLGGGFGDDVTSILSENDRDFEGTGITMSLDMRRPIAQSRLAAVCNLRGSVLWGDNSLDQTITLIEVVPVAAGTLVLGDFEEKQGFSTDHEGMWIGELQAGGEWNTPLPNSVGGGNAFLRVLFEAQWWHMPEVTNGVADQVYSFLGVTAAAGFSR